MKKKIFGAVLITAMAVAAGWNFNQSKNETQLSDLTLANVEALARWESQVELQFITGDKKPCMNCPEIGATYCDCD
ncbi:hypothetical protein DXA15_23485 [Parabacteroides sp. AM58-2XD]|uniref:NVEALA domain-containing protein n=1 Tax=Parabacteroides TaxID=375288 RepID=UPI000FE1A328|nr:MULTISPECIES: NVEALA domain-containing protein [Parabacteroides]RGY91636.1 hypothetical protein DXA15_23485 [Parabacteroides sp. AM58-2XD]GKG71889.1 hypothetical protein CE91St1_10320 [Parabacteroides goldsteinii]GKG77824.1 hypothetical protein CE91St2_10160 [Parabacteroides goldsteinii]